ncbi:MAG: hypothetical protein EON93_05955 [Burkholderiales bacterium]|nr:MAG: hypothetical protein EON93_05955 [Burkholderiales bacterium]
MRRVISGWNRQVRWSVCAAIGLHLALFVYDVIVGFAPFLQGDRAWDRMAILQNMLKAPAGEWLKAAVNATVVPGEYLFQIPVYLIAGTGGVVLLQVVLTVLSVGCVAAIGRNLFSWRFAGLAAALVYMLVPQNIVYPHQFVTEAISTPFCVFFLYFMVRYLKQGTWTLALYAGLCLGIAIFSRPSLALVIVGLTGLCLLYWRYSGLKRIADLATA